MSRWGWGVKEMERERGLKKANQHLPVSFWWWMVTERERRKERKRGSETIVFKEAVALSKLHCTTSSSALYPCIHGNGLFYHPKKLPLSAHTEDREWGGLQGRRSPTCKWCECLPAGWTICVLCAFFSLPFPPPDAHIALTCLNVPRARSARCVSTCGLWVMTARRAHIRLHPH